MTARKKDYLGDSVYAADAGGWGIVLTTENGRPTDPSNTIYLEPPVLDALIRFARSLGWTVGRGGGQMSDYEKPCSLNLTVSARLTSWRSSEDMERFGRRMSMTMKFEDCCTRVSQGDEPLGSVNGCIGGGIEIEDEKTGRFYYIGPSELWEAFQQSISEEAP